MFKPIAHSYHRRSYLQTFLHSLKKPAVPEVLKGCTWNQKIYGKAGNYSIYPNGDKKLITDEQAEEIKNYLTLKEEYRKKVNEIKNA